ncbi:hypothetical protein Tco_0175568 [Tanacetum coccineum]
MQEVILFYNGLRIPTRQILDSRGAIPSKTVADAKERGFGSLPSSTEANLRDQVKSISTTIEADSCPIRHIRSSQYAELVACYAFHDLYRRSFTLPCFINNVCFDNALVDLGASISVMPLSTYLSLRLGELAYTRLTIVLADRTVKYPKRIAENVLVGIGKFTFPVDFIILDMPKDIKVPLILESVKRASSLIKRVYMLSLRERMELDLEARLMGETLVLNRSLDPFFEDYIKLNDLNEPFELRRNQGDDLMPTIEEGDVIEEFRTMDDEIDAGINDYLSYCDDDKKIHIDCVHNLKFSCMIGFEFTHANFFPLLYVNVMSKKFHNSIMKDKMVYNRNNVVGALMNVPIFVGPFSVVTDFAVLENMDAYRDEGMGDAIFGEQFLREVGIKTRRFEGMRVLRYLKAYADADWVNCPKTRRSVIGLYVLLGKTLVSWISKKHATIYKSSSETEYRSMSSASCEVVWIDKVLAGIIKTVKVSWLEKIQGGKDMFQGKSRFKIISLREDVKEAGLLLSVESSCTEEEQDPPTCEEQFESLEEGENVSNSAPHVNSPSADIKKQGRWLNFGNSLKKRSLWANPLGFSMEVVLKTWREILGRELKGERGILGILVGDNMANLKAWDETIAKMIKRLSKWKLDTLSHSGLRRDFFYGVKDGDRKIAWIKWTKVLASKKFGGLGVSSLFALNRALIFKWVWRFLSHDNSLWSRVIAAVHGSSSHPISAAYNSPWGTIIKEVKALNDKEVNKDCSVADKINAPFTSFLIPFRSQLGGGPEGSSKLEPLSKSS